LVQADLGRARRQRVDDITRDVGALATLSSKRRSGRKARGGRRLFVTSGNAASSRQAEVDRINPED
jgi:hypothetical protein